ncbi:MAG TPA: hypothetical protein VJQ57_13800 [Acidimicrobiia bacterium]|nr:hypothetical protein [Acidimicrobiia bacterium]
MDTGGDVYGMDFPPSQFDQDWTPISNITATSYEVGDPEVAVSVTAPTSGRVFVAMGCGIRNNAATAESAYVSYQIFEDSPNGALYSASDDDRGVRSCGIAQSQEFQYHGNGDLIEGLEPGRSYYFQMTHKTALGAGTADIASRNILVIPVP